MDTWIYNNMVLPVVYIKKDILRAMSRSDAEKLINRKCYKYISKTYKEKLLNENFK